MGNLEEDNCYELLNQQLQTLRFFQNEEIIRSSSLKRNRITSPPQKIFHENFRFDTTLAAYMKY